MEVIASDLKAQLDKLNSVLSGKGLVENSNKFIFDGDGIFAFNGEIFVATCFENDLTGSVEGSVFYSLISKLGTSKITLDVVDGNLIVKKGKSTSKFSFDEEAECPLDLDIEDWKKLPKDFLEAVNICSYTTGTDYTDMRTVCIHLSDSFAESSDVTRITLFEMKGEIEDELFIPNEVLSFFNKSKPVYYAITDNWIYYQDLDETIVCHRRPTFDNEYPDLRGMVDSLNGFKEIELPEKLYDSLSKASVFQEGKFDQDKAVKISCKKGKLRLISKSITGSYSESMKVGFEDALNFEVNPAFLMQMMEKSNVVSVNGGAIKIKNNNVTYVASLNGD